MCCGCSMYCQCTLPCRGYNKPSYYYFILLFLLHYCQRSVLCVVFALLPAQCAVCVSPMLCLHYCQCSMLCVVFALLPVQCAVCCVCTTSSAVCCVCKSCVVFALLPAQCAVCVSPVLCLLNVLPVQFAVRGLR